MKKVLGGDRGIRPHTAGRDLACKPIPSSPTREVSRDFTPLENENAPHGAFELLGGEGGIRTHGRLASTPDFESGTFDHSATSPTHIELYLAPVLNLKEVLTRILC